MIGSHLVDRLIAHNHVTVIDDLSSGHLQHLPQSENLLFYPRSILEEEALKRVFKWKFDCIFHLAAQFANQNSVDYPRRDLLVNGMGTLKVLQYAVETGVERLVFASSSCMVGNQSARKPAANAHPALDTPYAVTKALGEDYVRYFHKQYGLKTVILRYFNSFGPRECPGQYRSVIANFFRLAMLRQPLVITGSGDETRDFNYCLNTVEGTVLAALSEEAVGLAFDIGSGVETRIVTLAEKINRLVGNSSGIRFVARRNWDSIDRRLADIKESRRVLGYTPTISLDKGLQLTYEWMKQARASHKSLFDWGACRPE